MDEQIYDIDLNELCTNEERTVLLEGNGLELKRYPTDAVQIHHDTENSESGEKKCDSVRKEFNPFIGQCFLSEEEAFICYKQYASRKGFSIRKDRTFKKNGELRRRDFCCQRQGKTPLKLFDPSKEQRNRKSVKCGCRARMRITLRKSLDGFPQEWRITEFVKKHNHVLVADQNGLLNDEEREGNSLELNRYPTDSDDTEDSECGQQKYDYSVRNEFDPFIGKRFLSEEEAFLCYRQYACENGFSIRKDRTAKKNGEVKRRDFCCQREGKTPLKVFDPSKDQRNRKSVKCGCKARMRITLKKSLDCSPQEWQITGFVKEHNHELLASSEFQCLLENQKIEDEGGLSVGQIMRFKELEKNLNHGYLPFFEKDLLRHCEAAKEENYMYYEGYKRIRSPSEENLHGNVAAFACMSNEREQKKARTGPQVIGYSDPLVVHNLSEELGSGKFESLMEQIKDLVSRKRQVLNPHFAMDPIITDVEMNLAKEASKVNQLATSLAHQDVLDLDNSNDANDVSAERLPIVVHKLQVVGQGLPVGVLNSDEEETGDKGPFNPYQEIVLPKPTKEFLMKNFRDRDCANGSSRKDNVRLPEESETPKDKGVYVGVEDDMEIEDGNCQTDTEYDGLADIWKEMNVALEYSKDTEDPPPDERERGGQDQCDHTFVLKDDLGYVCRICGVIQRGIETIIEYHYAKSMRDTRTRTYEGWTMKDKDAAEIFDGVKSPGPNFVITDITGHPKHMKQMKPHQVEGFNFLLSNLVSENPSGCILAHAPGSGKTFMIISFMQSFLAKYPQARPLVVLPRGILATWKKEFQRWQVEDLPLLDFYSVKADNRTQQLEVLKQWADQKSILFLGYKQFSSIVCANETSKSAVPCQEILLTYPSILILDEGHTPRNENTNVLNSLKKVQTPRKVVLSGTLYQNHVKEVFNIFDLVRPRFLRMDTSRAIIRRILSRVPFMRKHVKAKGLDNVFYESVELTLQKDQNFKRKVTVIQDLREMTGKVLHFYKGDCLEELPGLVDFTVLLNLSPMQKHEVEELKLLKRKFKICSDGSALYLHPQLRYLLKNTPRERDGIDDAKMDQTLEKLDVRDGVKAKFFLNMLELCESGDEKLLVFSPYLQPLKFLERLAVKVKGWSLGKEIFVITGDSTSENRERSMDHFNTSPNAKIFFGSIKACGEGISLVGASRIIILDVHLNPSITRQAICRAFRPGQVKKVYTYRLVAADSPEEEDHATCFRKESIAKMWFEWNEYCGQNEFEMENVNVRDCGDKFLESPKLSEDVKALFKR